MSEIRLRAIDTARAALQKNPIFLDTETTGLGSTAEIVEISILDDNEFHLIDTLVHPRFPIPEDVTKIHGITNEGVENAPYFPEIWPRIQEILKGRLVVIYNAKFDVRMLRQSIKAWKPLDPAEIEFTSFDMMRLYAEYYGAWDKKFKDFKFQSLQLAGEQCKISLINSHRSAADCLLTRAILHQLAESR